MYGVDPARKSVVVGTGNGRDPGKDLTEMEIAQSSDQPRTLTFDGISAVIRGAFPGNPRARGQYEVEEYSPS